MQLHSHGRPVAASPRISRLSQSLVALVLTGLISWPLLAATEPGDPPPSACFFEADPELSPIAAAVLAAIETVPGALGNSPTEPHYLATACNRFEGVYIDGPEIFAAARDLIAGAEHEVNLMFYRWDPASEAAGLIGDGLIAAQEQQTTDEPLLVRFLVDDYEPLDHAAEALYTSQLIWQSRGLDTSRVELQFATSGRNLLSAVLHDKTLVVDGKYVLVTGANVQSENDAVGAWHDTAYVVAGDAAISALSAFEQVWYRPPIGDDGTFYWQCSPQDSAPGCYKRSPFPTPDRYWLRDGQAFATMPVIAAGRKHSGSYVNPPNETNSPQDLAWLVAMGSAEHSIHIESPNLNDDAFRAAVLQAVGRGVTVKIIAPLGFNHFWQNFSGGDNQEVLGELRQDIRSAYPSHAENFHFRWYSRDGLEPIEGNVPGTSHTKYMTVDGEIAIVGSGNQDTVSWNASHELNLLLDSESATGELEAAVFGPDWDTSIGSYLELYEGNGGSQELVCPIASVPGIHKNVRFSETRFCDNDEARSLLLHDIAAGTVVRLYDDPERRYEDDDWTEIIVKRDVARKYVDSFETPFEDSDVRVITHRDNGLDGKVSSAEISTSPIGPVIDLYEGNNGTQDLVCSSRGSGPKTIHFQGHPHCDNDEARSLKLYDFPADRVVFLYDSPGGLLEDDWTVIIPKQAIDELTIDSFELELHTAEVDVLHFPNNGLDGKVSRLRIGLPEEIQGIASFYEGNGGTQNKVCDLQIVNQTVKFKSHGQCDNDEARSLVLRLAPAGSTLVVYDDPDCRTNDDFTTIEVKRQLGSKLISTFESSFEDDDVKVTYWTGGNLDGKVSCVRITVPSQSQEDEL